MNSFAKLQKIIECARTALEVDPRGNLSPGYRQAVWAALGDLDDHGRTLRARLAIATARHVLPAFEGARPGDATARKTLELAEAILAGASDLKKARAQYDTIFVYMDNTSNESEDKIPVSAGYAAVQALRTSIYDEAFDPCKIDLELTDDDIDPFDRDAGYFAAIVAAGGPPWILNSDAGARKSFWIWWLAEALCLAAKKESNPLD